MRTPNIDFPAITKSVAFELLGEPTSQTATELRYGNKCSLSIDLQKGTYFDHEAGQGGGLLDLIKAKTGEEPQTWLEEHHFIDHAFPGIPPQTISTQVDYIYRDESGSPVFRVSRRYDPEGKRSFSQAPYKDGKWLSEKGCMNGVRRVPYMLPAIIERKDEIIHIVEGEKDADRLSSLGLLATCNPGGAGKWKALSDEMHFFRGRDVVIFPDNDETGRRHAHKVKESLVGVAASVKLVELPGLTEKGDVSDFLDNVGTLEELRKIIQTSALEPESEPEKDRAFRLVPVGEIKTKPPQWLIKDFLEADSLVEIFGDPGCGKSFLAIDAACCVASGKDFHGLKVKKQGSVVFIAGEGKNGLKRRFLAWCLAHNVDQNTLPLLISSSPAQLCLQESVSQVEEALKLAAEKYGAPTLIVIDTLARNSGGNENDTEEMTRFVNACDQLRALNGSTVFLIHHSGHADKSRARGSMAIKGALDAEYRLDKDKEGAIRLNSTKMKDAEPPEPMAFILEPVFLDFSDDDGERVFSVVLESIPYEPPSKTGVRGLGKWQTVAVSTFEDLLAKHRNNLESGGYDPETARVSVDDWKDACEKRDMPRQRFSEIKNTSKILGLQINSGFVEKLE